MRKYSLNEGNESLKRVLLMMGYDSRNTLEENTKNIFEQDNVPVVNQDEDNALDPNIVAKASQPVAPVAGVTPAPATPEVSLSYEDMVKKLQNLLITKYKANLGKSGADGKIGKLTLDAIGNAVKSKLSQQQDTTTDGSKQYQEKFSQMNKDAQNLPKTIFGTQGGETPKQQNDGIVDDDTPKNNTPVQGQIQSTISNDEEF